MRRFAITEINRNDRRDIHIFMPPADFPKSVEAKVIVVKDEAMKLGNHSHAHIEGFILASGSCTVRTWTEGGGVEECELSAPEMFVFEPGEEHLLTCSKGMILAGFMPLAFKDQVNTPATHL